MSGINHFDIIFLRHGESVGNLENRFQGHADFPLTETGRAQANALAFRWQEEGCIFDLIISSPLARARETAEIIRTRLDVLLEFEPDWMEINNGLLAGMNDEEADRTVPRPQFMTPFTHYGKTGESRWELYLRAGRAVQHLLDRPLGRYLVVAHGGILNMTMYAILGIPLQADFSGPRFMFDNTTFASFTYEPEHHNWHLLNFDNRPHWKEE
jgi:2,3-bisphosphoglycerate-dependent phosphoglycerate mutase